MSIRERPAGAGLRELETFGRRLADTQGVSGDARVDWVAYGRAAQDALRRGHGIPLVGPFVAPERLSDVTRPRLRSGPASSRPVSIRTPLLSNRPTARQSHLVRPAASFIRSHVWLPRPPGPRPTGKRIFSTAWCVQVGVGTSWRIAVVLVTLCLVATGVHPVDTALLVASASILLPRVVRDPGISLLRWSLLSAFVVRVIATNSLGYVLVGALMSAPLAAILSARSWRLT